MKTIYFICIILFSITIQGQNNKEIIQDKRQIEISKAQLDRDIKEFEQFKSQCLTFRNFINNQNFIAAKKSKNVLLKSMNREIAQTEIKTKRARVEISQSNQEIKTDQREKRRNRRQYTGSQDDKNDIIRDRINTRDDRRDRKDDINDYEELKNRLRYQTSLTHQLKNASIINSNQIDYTNIYKETLLKFIKTMEQDIKGTRKELKEDRKEKREDKRERRDDRQERQEKY